MRQIFLLLFLVMIAFCQTSIPYNPALYESGIVYSNRVSDDIAFLIGTEGGPNSWDFSSYLTGEESDFEVVDYSSSLPEIASCAMVPNYIVYNHTVTDTSDIQGYGYLHQNSNRVIGLGLWGEMTIDGSTYSLTSFPDTYSPSNEFPMSYEDDWTEISHGTGEINYIVSINYEYWDTSYYEIDAWGTIILPLGIFQALRVKKRHHKRTYSSHFLFGFDKTEREFGYQWYCYELGLTASWMGPKDTLGGLPDSTFSIGKLSYQSANTMLAVNESPIITQSNIDIYPNPFKSNLQICSNEIMDIQIFDLNGKCVLAKKQTDALSWKPGENISNGIYLVKTDSHGQRITRTVSYIK